MREIDTKITCELCGKTIPRHQAYIFAYSHKTGTMDYKFESPARKDTEEPDKDVCTSCLKKAAIYYCEMSKLEPWDWNK